MAHDGSDGVVAGASGRLDEVADRILTPVMSGVGYLRIRISPGEPPAGSTSKSCVGYEAAGEEVRRRMMPNDPLTADEAWVCWDIETNQVTLSAVLAVARDAAQTTRAAATPEALVRVGHAIARLTAELAELRQ